jgi:hypothetical protein
MTENEIAKELVDAAFKVHQALGPGLLESAYEIVLAYELERRGLQGRSPGPDRDPLRGTSHRWWVPSRPRARR